MPIVNSDQSKHVLVTGANGYVALWVVRTLLEQGYIVRGTVRSEDKGILLLETFKEFKNCVEVVVVDDMAKEGAFDHAVVDVDAIQHVASPVSFSSDDPDELILPAISGTLSVLKSALKYGSSVKRIVITSSCAAIQRDIKEPGFVYNENDWADESILEVKELGKKASPTAKYRASKALAERAAWEFYEEHKDEVKWDLVTILPAIIVGPTLQDVKTPGDLNLSMTMFYKPIFTEVPDTALKAAVNYVHVRDVADAHVESLKKEAAGGNRIIVVGDAITGQYIRNIVHKLYPELYSSGTLPRGNIEIENKIMWTYNTERSKKLLGTKYRTMEDVVRDIVEDIKSRGWWKTGQFPSS